MKLLRYAIFMFLCSFIASCEKDDVMTEITEPDDRIEITDENIQGEWMAKHTICIDNCTTFCPR